VNEECGSGDEDGGAVGVVVDLRPVMVSHLERH
jgi:hypothetical protein